MNYSPDQVSVVFGPVIVDGFASGDMITVEQIAPAFSRYDGADGKTMRVRSTNRSLRITIRTMQGSAANDLLSLGLQADLLPLANGANVVPFSLKDNSGRTVVGATYAWVAEWPSISFGEEAGEREWVIETSSEGTVTFVGGN
jgi:Protein of unknown function (DUF3277)